MGDSSTVVAVDLGGTTIKAARINAQGGAEERLRVPTPAGDGSEAVLAAVAETAAALTRPGTVAVGLCAPGLIDRATGVVRFAANLRLYDAPLARTVADRTRLPVTLEHDVRAATLAEQRLGSGNGCRDLLVVVLGTGVAAGIVSGGVLIGGAQAMAGEFGHICVHADGELCQCGQRGCVEAYAAARAVVDRYRRHGKHADSAADVTARLKCDPAAAGVWAEATDALGRALAMTTVLLDPEKIVLAGGMSVAGPLLSEPVRTALQRRLAWRSAPPVEISPLGADAGLFGAALHALETTEAFTFTELTPEPALGGR
ncbi:ROK family protein [Streptomyces herbicida]|uniref:ROK family protein n=1 Tax=Streptomyces herbicida TaxID=3065675 RepID=UPI00292CE424|nr:ROK family protein [Streptomyces sp. NEAU-HV9]